MIKKTSYIDTETGEYNEKLSFVDNVVNSQGLMLGYNRIGVKIFSRSDVYKDINTSDIGKIVKLCCYITKDQLLGYNQYEPLTRTDIEVILGIKKRQTLVFIQDMKKIGVLKEIRLNDTKWFSINPLYFMRGKRISPLAYKIFEKEIKREVSDRQLDKLNMFFADLKPNFKVIP